MSEDLARVLRKAIIIATKAHHGQADKAGRPYIEPPIRVMDRLPADDLVGRIVAVLHDVMEDTPVDVPILMAEGIPHELCKHVDAITKRPRESSAEYLVRVHGDPVARRVKRADIADNLSPHRLIELDDRTVFRLRRKYQRCTDLLDALDAFGENDGRGHV